MVSNSPCSINIFLSSLWVRQGAVWSTIHSVLVSGYWFTDLFFNCGQSWWSCQEALLCAGLHRTEAVRLHTYPRLCDCNRRLSHTQCVLTTPWSIQPWTLVESWVPSLLLSCSDVWMESMAECSFCLWCHRFTGEIMNSSRKLRPQTLQVLTLIPVVSHSKDAKDLPDATKQNHISLKKQRSNSQTVHSPSSGYALRSYPWKSHNLWQGTALEEANTNWKHVWLPA